MTVLQNGKYSRHKQYAQPLHMNLPQHAKRVDSALEHGSGIMREEGNKMTDRA